MKRKASNEAQPPASEKTCIKQIKSSAPDYGSKFYWEARYKGSLPSVDAPNNTGNRLVNGVDLSEVQAGHSWYFSYEELRPLIVDLILNDEDDVSDVLVEDYLTDDDGDDGWEEVSDGVKDDELNEDDSASDSSVQESQTDTNNNEIDPLEARLIEASSQSTHSRRPKSVLEIGCGDVPLGASLAFELNDLQNSTGCNARNIVSRVECIDYSSVVIENLEKEQRQQQQQNSTTRLKVPPIHPIYSVNDARSLPQIENNSISLILEKGTLDAMLSHPNDGITNSIAIIKEMARICRINGSIFIVSHLNAREEKGMGWVRDVLLLGLKEEWLERERNRRDNNDDEMEVLWSIEVHGGDSTCDYGDEKEEDYEPSFGPAVYILKKRGVTPTIFRDIIMKKEKSSGSYEDITPPVRLKFLTYS